jgi:hypothetical protein
MIKIYFSFFYIWLLFFTNLFIYYIFNDLCLTQDSFHFGKDATLLMELLMLLLLLFMLVWEFCVHIVDGLVAIILSFKVINFNKGILVSSIVVTYAQFDSNIRVLYVLGFKKNT